MQQSIQTSVLILGTLALIFGIWTLIGLLKRAFGKAKQRPRRKKIILGVCADFSQLVGIPLWVVRLYALLYAPFLVGIFFYLLYYLVMRLRKQTPPPLAPTERPLSVTKMDTYHY